MVGVGVIVGVGIIVAVGVMVGVRVIVGVGAGVGVSLSTTPRALRVYKRFLSSLTDTANPMLSTGLPPEVDSTFDVLMPITSPSPLIRGPPLLPGLIAASVCRRSTPVSVLLDETIPLVTVRASPILSASGKPEREHLVAHPHAVGVPDPDRMEPLGSPKVNEGDVGCRVFLQHPSFIGLAVRQSNLHYVRIAYNMLIGYDQAVRADNKTRSASIA